MIETVLTSILQAIIGLIAYLGVLLSGFILLSLLALVLYIFFGPTL